MGNRDIKDADTRLQLAWAFILTEWPRLYPNSPLPFLSEVYRSPDLQRAYYAQGRDPLARVNSQRRLVNLAPITEEENRHKVTNSKPGQSKHQSLPSKAIDVLFVKPGTQREISQDINFYKALAKMVRGFNPEITWGADWNHNWRSDDERLVDMPHFEVQ
ncbi:M15 family metallopeptidase [Dyadobacter frigoris]|uniref:M15 family metallopeptidase n=1 Tax=Dyadobacter frigoris TaxID=2576211 RepID=A0A4U6D5Z1_9BACT|nr:M15 family metallopeptidase [Dyadobacter frigoris]TKT89474.1 M15 family metallopeptidase [Dyadobacter frigoris]